MDAQHVREKRIAPLHTRSAFASETIRDVTAALNRLLSDIFVLYLKTKNFHWHASGETFRSDHLMFDEQAGEILAMTDPIAERVRKIGGVTVHSIGEIFREHRLLDNDADYVTPRDMLAELRDDNMQIAAIMRETHGLCMEVGDVATTSLLETWIDEAEGRAWFLFESSSPRHVAPAGFPVTDRLNL